MKLQFFNNNDNLLVLPIDGNTPKTVPGNYDLAFIASSGIQKKMRILLETGSSTVPNLSDGDLVTINEDCTTALVGTYTPYTSRPINGVSKSCSTKKMFGEKCSGDSQCSTGLCNLGFCDKKKENGTLCIRKENL